MFSIGNSIPVDANTSIPANENNRVQFMIEGYQLFQKKKDY